MERIPYRVYFLSCSNSHLLSTATQNGKNSFTFFRNGKAKTGIRLNISNNLIIVVKDITEYFYWGRSALIILSKAGMD